MARRVQKVYGRESELRGKEEKIGLFCRICLPAIRGNFSHLQFGGAACCEARVSCAAYKNIPRGEIGTYIYGPTPAAKSGAGLEGSAGVTEPGHGSKYLFPTVPT